MNEVQFNLPGKSDVTQDVQCPANTVLTGGGVTILDTANSAPVAIESSGPVNSTTWHVEVATGNPNTHTLGAWVMCATDG